MFKLLSISLLTVIAFQWTQASETVEGAKKDIQSLKKEMIQRLNKVENELEALNAEAKNKGSKIKEQTLTDLEKTRDKLRLEINNLGINTKKSWDQMKKNLSESIESLHLKIQKALEPEPTKE